MKDMKNGIRKRSKNSYEIFISQGKDPDTGKYNYHWETVRGTKKEAEKRRTELLHQLDTGTFIKPSKTTFAEYLERWLQDYVKPELSPRSYERYTGIIKKYFIPEMGNIPLTQLKPEHIQGHVRTIRDQGLKPETIKFHHAVIHKALQTAVKWGLLYAMRPMAWTRQRRAIPRGRPGMTSRSASSLIPLRIASIMPYSTRPYLPGCDALSC